jgi:hypothetical protein
MGTGFFTGVNSGRGVKLTSYPLLESWSWKGRAIPLLPPWAVRSVQSLSACTRVTFTLTSFFYLRLRNCAHKITSLYPVPNRINSVYSPLVNILKFNVRNDYITMQFQKKHINFYALSQNCEKATVSFVVFVLCVSVRCTEQLGSQWRDFREIWCLIICRSPVENTPVLLKSDKNNGHFTWWLNIYFWLYFA